MDSSFNSSSRLVLLIGRLAAFAGSVSLTLATPAFADLVDQRNEMASKFVTEMHADPLVADCAAHGEFVASTSSVIDHVDFPPESFDSVHAKITPWNESFDQGKQHVKVDNVVTVEAFGVPHNATQSPIKLKFRCGYVGTQMLAFSWNDPAPAAKKPSGTHKGKGKKSTVKGTGKAVRSKSSTTDGRTANKSATNHSSSSKQSAAKRA